MKLIHEKMEHILVFKEGYVNELVIENKKLFFEIVKDISLQSEGIGGGFILSISDRPVELSRHTDVTVQFAPFQLNRKSLLTKLYSALEQAALLPENYTQTGKLLSELESYVHYLAEDFPFEIDCKKAAIGPIIRALSPEIEEYDKSTVERIFSYMETVRELDRDRLFVMINMRSYFPDEEMEKFVETVCLHDFKLLLIESNSLSVLANTKRYTVDEDLCEF